MTKTIDLETAKLIENELRQALEPMVPYHIDPLEFCREAHEVKNEHIRKALYLLESQKRKHYVVIGGHTGEIIGCTYDQSDVLVEEPLAKFEEVEVEKCPVCNAKDEGQ